MPKRKYRAALQSALSARLSDGGVTVVSDFVLAEPKTKLLAKVLAGLGLLSSTLIVAGESHHDLARAARNLPAVKLVRPEELNVYDVLRYDAILIPERELARVKEAWS
jgi:large subunit ribosomal protein L4